MPYIQTARTPYPDPALRRLDILIGNWKQEGHFTAEPTTKIMGTQSYEWMEGGFFLLSKWSSGFSGYMNGGLLIIGYHSPSEDFLMHYFDHEGSIRRYTMTLNEGVLKIIGETERYTGAISEDGKSITGFWEQTDNGKQWKILYESKFTKQSLTA